MPTKLAGFPAFVENEHCKYTHIYQHGKFFQKEMFRCLETHNMATLTGVRLPLYCVIEKVINQYLATRCPYFHKHRQEVTAEIIITKAFKRLAVKTSHAPRFQSTLRGFTPHVHPLYTMLLVNTNLLNCTVKPSPVHQAVFEK